MITKVSKTAMKFLSLAAKVNSFSKQVDGTHAYNLKDWFGPLDAAGYLDTSKYPIVRITPAGRAALDAHIAAGGKVVK